MDVISLARGVPAPECLPVVELAECARAAFERDAAELLSYGAPGGYGPLREWIAAEHRVEPGRVLLTAGSLQGFVLVAQQRLSARPGRVLVEAPTYDRPLAQLEALGAEVVPLPVDAEGLVVDALERELRAGPQPSFLYTIPTFQNPTGLTLSTDRRRRLVELAHAYDLLVFEDDPYGLVRFDGEAEPSLRDLSGDRHVLYSSSFSKTVAPGLRVGYVLLPPELVAPIERLAASTYISPAPAPQAIVFEFVRRGLFESNLVRVRDLLRRRRDAMLAALAQQLPYATWTTPAGGYFVWLELSRGVDADDLHAAAARAGVAFVRGCDFYLGGSGGHSALRLAYSAVSPELIAEGVARLAGLVPLRAAA